MKPEELFKVLHNEASPAGALAKLTVARLADDQELYDERQHDVKNALRAVDTLLTSLKSGYKMDDANAPLYLARLEAALRDLKVETSFWQQCYEPA